LTTPFDNALRLYFTKDEVKNYNHDRIRDCNQPVKKLKAHHTGSQAEKASSDEAEGLDLELDICIGARVYLTQNLWVDHGLVNGSMGTVRELVWKEGQDPTKELPFAIMVEFDKYTGPCFPGYSFVPIFQSLRRFQYGGTVCTRSMFPLRLAYAITVYKSQGLTLQRAVLCLEKKDFAIGLSYVAISRVKALEGLLFEGSFDLERFHVAVSPPIRDRALDHQLRGNQMI
jgi:ATP-dependent exoDNAse (exonuclease V) alpha subunit